MSMSRHVSSVCSAVYHCLGQIRKVRHYITSEACKSAVQSLVISKLDYTSGLLGISKADARKLQTAQNAAARLIRQPKLREPITPVLRSLHWLPMYMQIRFRLCTYIFWSLEHTVPEYLCQEICFYVPPRPLRSGNQGRKFIQKT